MVIARPQPEQLGKFGDTGEFPEALVPAPEVGLSGAFESLNAVAGILRDGQEHDGPGVRPRRDAW